jgi:hypothetical protein
MVLLVAGYDPRRGCCARTGDGSRDGTFCMRQPLGLRQISAADRNWIASRTSSRVESGGTAGCLRFFDQMCQARITFRQRLAGLAVSAGMQCRSLVLPLLGAGSICLRVLIVWHCSAPPRRDNLFNRRGCINSASACCQRRSLVVQASLGDDLCLLSLAPGGLSPAGRWRWIVRRS